MSMSDCVKCWDTPCTCGYDYESYSEDRKEKLILAICQQNLEFLKKNN